MTMRIALTLVGVCLFALLVGALQYSNMGDGDPSGGDNWQPPELSSATPLPAETEGWWAAMPTAPAVPGLPAGSATPTASSSP